MIPVSRFGQNATCVASRDPHAAQTAQAIPAKTDQPNGLLTNGQTATAREFARPRRANSSFLRRHRRGSNAMKSVYDIGLYILFRNVEVEGERPPEPTTAG